MATPSLYGSAGVEIHANLMLPTLVYQEGTKKPVRGLAIVEYDSRDPNAAWTRVVAGDVGAGTALTTGQVQCVEDTSDPKWFGAFKGSRARSFASFPVIGDENQVIAVVNIDASKPKVLTPSNSAQLYRQVLAAPLMLMAELLGATPVGIVRSESLEEEEDLSLADAEIQSALTSGNPLAIGDQREEAAVRVTTESSVPHSEIEGDYHGDA
jgi:hypothetical protein